MRVLLDNDVVLDYILKRPPSAAEAKGIFDCLAKTEFEAYVAPITFNNVFYVIRKAQSKTAAFQAVEKLIKILEVCVANKNVMQNALFSNFIDYEDAAQHACAEAENLDAIVTRNLSDYKNATIPVYSPPDFLDLLKTL